MANKKVAIEFQSNGIKDIIRELDELQRMASSITITQDLDDQIANMGEAAQNVKDALKEIKEALEEVEETKVKNQSLTRLDTKLDGLKEKISVLSKAFKSITDDISRNVDKIDTSIAKINQPNAFNGLLEQMGKVSEMFKTLKTDTVEFKDEIYSKGKMPLVNEANKTQEPKAKGRPKGPDFTKDAKYNKYVERKEKLKEASPDIEINRSLSPEQYEKTVEDIARQYNEALKQRNELAKRVEEISKQLVTVDKSSQEYKTLMQERNEVLQSEMLLRKELLQLGKAYDQYVNVVKEYNADNYNLKISDREETALFKDISDLNVNDFNAWYNYRPMADDYIKEINRGIKEYLKSLDAQIEKRKEALKRQQTEQTKETLDTSVAEQVEQIVSEATEGMEHRGRPKKDVVIAIQIDKDSKQETIDQLNTIIQEIEQSDPHIDINLNLVSDHILKRRESLVSQLTKAIQGETDPDVKKQLENLIPKIDKTFKGDVKLNIATNIPELAEQVPGAIRAIQSEVSNIPIDLHLKVNDEDIRQQVEKMGKLSIPIGEITLSKDLYKNIVNEAEEAEKKVDEATKKTTKKTKNQEESIAVALNDTLAQFMRDLTKVPTVVKGIYEAIGNVPIKANVEFDETQVQEALNLLQNLVVKIDKIDVSKAVLDQLKIDVKGGLEELVPVGKSIVVEVMRLCNLLTPIQRQARAFISDDPNSTTPQPTPLSQDVSTYLRDGITVLISLVGSIATSVENLDKIKLTVETQDAQTAVADGPQDVKLEQNTQLEEIVEAISAVVRALHLINKQLTPLHHIGDGNRVIADDGGKTIKVEFPTHVEESVDAIASEFSSYAHNILNILNQLNNPSTEQSANEKVSLDAESCSRIIAMLEGTRDSITASLSSIKDLNIVASNVPMGENDESIASYIGAVIRTIRLLQKQIDGIGTQITNLQSTVSTEQTLSTINGKINDNTTIVNNQQSGNGTTRRSTTRTSNAAATDRRNLSGRIESILNKRNSDGSYYYTQSYREEAERYANQLAAGRGNRRNIHAFVRGNNLDSNIAGSMRDVDTYLADAQRLLTDLDLPESTRVHLEQLVQQMNNLRDSTEVTREQIGYLKRELNNNKKFIDTEGLFDVDLNEVHKVLGDLRKASQRRGKYGLFYTDETVSALNNMRNNLYHNPSQDTLSTARNYLDTIVDSGNIRTSGSRLLSYINKGEKLLSTGYLNRDTQNRLESLIQQMERLSSETNVSDEAVSQLIRQFKGLEKEAAQTGKTLWGQVGQRLQDMNAKFLATFLSFHDLIRYGRNIISVITDLDTALTEMRKVSDESLESLKEYQKVTFETANALGTTAVQLQQSTADWLRLGESMEEASKSAVSAITLLNVSEFENINEATTALVAMSQAYKDLDKTEIIDVLNNIGNNYAIATDQLATALQASSSALVTQGNDLYEAAALVTAGNAVIQDASKTGTGIRTISLRIAGMKLGKEELEAELNELGEEVDDWVMQTEAKKREAIMSYTAVASNGGKGVDILDANGNLKDTYHIMLEISKVYKEIQEEDKKYGTNRAQGLVEELAGKVRSNIAASILMNPELLENVYDSAIESAGSAAEENAKYLDSIVGKTQQVSNEWQRLQSNVVNSDDYKAILDILTSLLQLINKFNKALPALTASLLALSTTLANQRSKFVNFLGYNENTQDLTGLFSNFGPFRQLVNDKIVQPRMDAIKFGGITFNEETRRDMERYFTAIENGYERADIATRGTVMQWIDTQDELRDSLNDTSRTLLENGVTTMGAYNNAVEQTATQTAIASASISSSVSMMNAAITMGLSLAFQGITLLVTKLINMSKEMERAANEARDFISDTNKELRGTIDTIDEVGEKYAQMVQKVSNLGQSTQAQGSLSTEEYEEFLEISNQLVEIFPQLQTGFTENGDALVDLNGDVDTIVGSLQRLVEVEKELKRAEMLEKAEDVYKQDKKDLDKYVQSLDEARQMQEKIRGALNGQSGSLYYKMLNGESISGTQANVRVEELFKGAFGDQWFQRTSLTQSYQNEKVTYDFNKLSQEDRQILRDYFKKLANQYERDALQAENDIQKTNADFAKYMSMSLADSFTYANMNDTDKKLVEKLVSTVDLRDADAKTWDEVTAWFENGFVFAISQIDSAELRTAMYDVLNDATLKSTEKVNIIEDILNQLTEKGLTEEDALVVYWTSRYVDETEKVTRGVEHILGGMVQGVNDTEGTMRARAKSWINELTPTQYETLMSKDIERNTINGLQDIYNLLDAIEDKSTKTYSGIGALLSQNTALDSITLDARYRTLQAEYDRELQLAESAGAELDRIIYGNIDLDKRGVLEWNTENLKKYKDAVESYGASIEDYADSISTVDAMSSEFDGVEIAFSPILQTPNGPEYLDADTVYSYINSLINQMPEGWNDADLFALDAEGLEIEGKHIQGLIAAIGNEAMRVGETMHFLGKDGSIALIQQQMDELQSSAISWKDVREDLIGLAQAGKLDETTLKQYEYFNEILKALGINAEDAEDHLSEMVDTINRLAVDNAVDDLANYRTEMDKLGDAYSKFQKGEFIDANTLSDLQDAFGYLDSYQAFEKAVLTGDSSLQEHFNNIVSEYAYVHNILSNLTEDEKEYYKQMLMRAGITEQTADAAVKDALQYNKALKNKVELAIEEINTDAVREKQLKKLVVDTTNLNGATVKEINELITETGVTGESAEMIKYYAIQKDLAKHKDLRNMDDINYLIEVCELAGIASASLQSLKHLAQNENVFKSAIEDADTALNKFRDSSGKMRTNLTIVEQQEINRILAQKETAQSALANMGKLADQSWEEVSSGFKEKFEKYEYKPNLDYSGVVEDATDGGSEAAEAFKEALDKILSMYDAELDAGVISFQTYVDKSRAIIEQYYRDGKIKAQDYYDELSDLYGKQVSQYDKVINAVQKSLQDETDALEKQKETIEKSYNDQIEVIQKKIDALQEENDEIDRNMELNKALYEWNRARNQRTRLIYSESRGFYYEADLKAVADAEDSVRKAKLNKQVAEYEKQIKNLQGAMESETKSIDDQIKKLNEYSEAWGKVSTQLEEAQNRLRATEVLGPNWENNIKSGLDLLETFTQQYVDAQQRQKQAYLDARAAEVNNPVNANGGGTDTTTTNSNNKNPKTPATDTTETVDTNQTPTDTNKTKAKSSAWYYDGKIMYSYEAAVAAQEQAEKGYWQDRYNYWYNKFSWMYDDKPRHLKAQDKAGEDLANYRTQHKIEKKSYFTGTDSAKHGESLVGELGSEIVLHKNGTASIIDSPTLMNLEGGEKIFNAEETEKILKSKYKPLSSVNPNKFKMLHAFAGGTTSATQRMIAAQAVGIASGINSGLVSTSNIGGQTINQTFNITMPNITDASKATDLINEFQHLSLRATQHFKRNN